MTLIARYLTKEVFWTFLIITGILLLIVLSNRFATYLAKAASGELPIGLVFNIVLLYIPELLSYLIPLGFFMAILFAHGRLHVDSEMIVMAACGVSWRSIAQITLLLGLIVMCVTALLTLWVVPVVADIREQALSKGETFGVMQSLLPGRFQTLAEGKLVFYLEDAAPRKESLKGVFIAERPSERPPLPVLENTQKNNTLQKNPQAQNDKVVQNNQNTQKNQPRGWALITAETANLKRNKDAEDYYLVLKNGERYQGLPGSANYTVVQFQEYGRLIPRGSDAVPAEVQRLKGSQTLLQSNTKEDAAELQWRLSLPLTVPILALIAVPLACVQPRFGRFAKFIPAIAIYILYYNLFTISKRWVTAGTLPSYIGVWWVHVIFILLGLSLLAKQSGWFKRQTFLKGKFLNRV